MEQKMSGYSTTIQPRFRDLDAIGHVNNAVYVTYLEVARVEWFNNTGLRKHPNDFPFIIARVEVDYRKAIELSTEVEISITVATIGTKSWTFDYKLTDRASGEGLANAKTVQVSYDYETGKSIAIPEQLRAYLTKELDRD
jgi:acyl-CoA thioester hydrolase